MVLFARQAPAVRLFDVPRSYHEILYEVDSIRDAALKAITDFFTQKSDDVSLVPPCYPLHAHDVKQSIYPLTEIIIRGVGIGIAGLGLITGVVMILSDSRKRW